MGLDVYVGSFTRYYAGDWEPAPARVARELGAKFKIIRTDDPPNAIRDPEQIYPIVIMWRKNLSDSLSESLPQPLDWNERPGTPYFTERLNWDGYNALRLWAAYEEHPGLRIPVVIPENPLEDAAFLLSTCDDSKTRYPDLLPGVQIWFPSDFSPAFRALDCAGRDVQMGSSVSLARQLDELNRRTWNLIESAEYEATPHGAQRDVPLEIAARAAFLLFRRLAALSLTNQLPMLLDW